MSRVSSGVDVSCRAAVLEAGDGWRATHHALVMRVAALDVSQEWVADGAATCAHWVADALDMEVSTARELVRIGRALMDLPVIEAAFGDGRISYSKVRTLTRVATVDTQDELLDVALQAPAGELARTLATWRAQRETPEETERRQHRARAWTWRDDVDGMVEMTVRCPPVDAGVIKAAIDALIRTRRPGASADAWPSLAQQRYDAGMSLFRRGGSAVTTELVMHIRGDGVTMDDGTPIPMSVIERIAPRSTLRAMIHDAESRPINVSGRHRHPTDRQKRLRKELDGGRCVDCGSTELVEFDHDPPFEETGRTLVDELAARCAPCHHRRHRLRRPRSVDAAGELSA